MKIDLNGQTISPSHSNLYMISLSSQDENFECSSRVCSRKLDMRWLGRNLTAMNILVTKLSATACADHGITIESNGERIEACRSPHLWNLTINQFSQISVSLWFANDAIISSVLYIWMGSLSAELLLPEIRQEEINIARNLVRILTLKLSMQK